MTPDTKDRSPCSCTRIHPQQCPHGSDTLPPDAYPADLPIYLRNAYRAGLDDKRRDGLHRCPFPPNRADLAEAYSRGFADGEPRKTGGEGLRVEHVDPFAAVIAEIDRARISPQLPAAHLPDTHAQGWEDACLRLRAEVCRLQHAAYDPDREQRIRELAETLREAGAALRVNALRHDPSLSHEEISRNPLMRRIDAALAPFNTIEKASP